MCIRDRPRTIYKNQENLNNVYNVQELVPLRRDFPICNYKFKKNSTAIVLFKYYYFVNYLKITQRRF